MTNLEVIQMLAEYYGKDMGKSQVNTYLITLDDIPVDLLDLTAKHLIKTGHPFMPRVSEIRKSASELKRLGKYSPIDPLKLISGAAQTEADLDERYGTREEHKEICEVFTSGGELSDRQQEILCIG